MILAWQSLNRWVKQTALHHWAGLQRSRVSIILIHVWETYDNGNINAFEECAKKLYGCLEEIQARWKVQYEDIGRWLDALRVDWEGPITEGREWFDTENEEGS